MSNKTKRIKNTSDITNQMIYSSDKSPMSLTDKSDNKDKELLSSDNIIIKDKNVKMMFANYNYPLDITIHNG